MEIIWWLARAFQCT